jgi:hypothetical protein
MLIWQFNRPLTRPRLKYSKLNKSGYTSSSKKLNLEQIRRISSCANRLNSAVNCFSVFYANPKKLEELLELKDDELNSIKQEFHKLKDAIK